MPSPSWTPIVDRATRYLVGAADWNDLVDNLAFLYQPPSCLLRKSGDYTTSSTSFEALPFTGGSEISDVYNMHNTGTNPEQIIVPFDGFYRVEASVVWDTNTTGQRALRVVNLNTGQTIAQDDGPSTLQANQHYSCAGADVVNANCPFAIQVQSSASGKTVKGSLAGDATCMFAVYWQGSG